MSTDDTKPGQRRPQSKVEHVWNSQGFISEISLANEVGPQNLSATELLRICSGSFRHIKKYFWVDCEDFFREMWLRIEEKRFPEAPTKRAACELVGCSMRWAELIVAGTAKRRKEQAASKNTADYDSHSGKPALRSNQEYVATIRAFAEKQMKPLWVRGESQRSRKIDGLLSQHFAHAAKIDHIDDLSSGPKKEAA
jgi:hypothetical protein